MAACRELGITKDTLRRILEQGPEAKNSPSSDAPDEKISRFPASPVRRKSNTLK
jgi:hypothetical protein